MRHGRSHFSRKKSPYVAKSPRYTTKNSKNFSCGQQEFKKKFTSSQKFKKKIFHVVRRIQKFHDHDIFWTTSLACRVSTLQTICQCSLDQDRLQHDLETLHYVLRRSQKIFMVTPLRHKIFQIQKIFKNMYCSKCITQVYESKLVSCVSECTKRSRNYERSGQHS